MVDISFLYNYKGALYPLEINSPSFGRTNHKPVPSLVDWCCQKIVLDCNSVLRALKVIPPELTYSLMKMALHLSRDRAIEVLVANWPSSVLSLKHFAPNLVDSVVAMYNDTYLSDHMRQGVKYTTCLAHTFVECLKRRAPTKLKYLDLTGYPTAEVIANYLSSHVLLVYNETKQQEIIKMYNEVTRDLPEAQRQQYNIQATLPEESYVIKLDAFLQTSETHMELCRALNTSKLGQCRFKLQVHKLDLNCLGAPRITVLLEQVDEEYLTGLRLQYNALTNEGLQHVGPAIRKMRNLTALDLSCNSVNLTNNDTPCDILAQTLASLPALTRLDLSNNRLQHAVAKILRDIPKPLQYLKLCACILSEADLLYLSRSHHASGLTELDLSENNLSKHFSAFLKLLQVVSENLCILEIEDCNFQERDLEEIMALSCRLRKLRYWNVSRNPHLTSELLMNTVSQIVGIPLLEAYRVSYPVECFISVEEEEVEEEKNEFHHRYGTLVSSVCDKKPRPHIKLILTM